MATATKTAYNGYDKLTGYCLGRFEPIVFENGEIGFQVVNLDGGLSGLLFANGQLDDVHASGNRTWVFSEETAEHGRLIRCASHSAEVRFKRA